MPIVITDNLRAIAAAAYLDLDRMCREAMAPVNEENPASYWPDTGDLDAEKGVKKAVELGVVPTKQKLDGKFTVQGWRLADGFWIGRYRFAPNAPFRYCAGQGWDDIWEG